MTETEMMMFLTVAQAGMRDGFSTPYEWYLSWMSHAAEGLPLDSPSATVYRDVTRAFANFFRACMDEDERNKSASILDAKIIERFRTIY